MRGSEASERRDRAIEKRLQLGLVERGIAFFHEHRLEPLDDRDERRLGPLVPRGAEPGDRLLHEGRRQRGVRERDEDVELGAVRLLRDARDAPEEIEQVALEVPVVRGLVCRRPLQAAQSRRAGLRAVNLEKRKQQAPALALFLDLQLVDELRRRQLREERQDPGEGLVVAGILAE